MTNHTQKQIKTEELNLFFQEEGLEEDYKKVSQKWDFVQLCLDLENLGRPVLNKQGDVVIKKTKLSATAKKILLLVLCEKEPKEIATVLYYYTKEREPNKQRVSEYFSKTLFNLIRDLTNKEVKNWRDIILRLMDQYYKPIQEDLSRYTESGNQYKTLILKVNGEVSQQTIDRLIETMKDCMDTQSLDEMFLTNVRKGCMETHWKASPEAIKKILELQKQGLLSQQLGVTVLDVKVEEDSLVNISNWLQGTWEQGWQTFEDFLNANQLKPVLGLTKSKQIRGFKKIDLGLRINQISVALVINVTPRNAGEMHILAQVRPMGEQQLPQGLKLLITLESGSAEAIARDADNLIQLGFTEDIGKSFIIELELGDSVMTEEFML